MPFNIELLKLVSTCINNHQNERIIILDALNCEDYNLARIIAESQLDEFESSFKSKLIKDEFYDYCELLETYRGLLKINDLITKLYEGV